MQTFVNAALAGTEFTRMLTYHIPQFSWLSNFRGTHISRARQIQFSPRNLTKHFKHSISYSARTHIIIRHFQASFRPGGHTFSTLVAYALCHGHETRAGSNNILNEEKKNNGINWRTKDSRLHECVELFCSSVKYRDSYKHTVIHVMEFPFKNEEYQTDSVQ
jgi:hypothetical protein